MNPVCNLCGGATIKRSGNWGAFYSCARFPKCKGKGRAHSAVKSHRPAVDPACRPAALGSVQQEAIWDFVLRQAGIVNSGKPASHLVVRAFAGTGKSFTCREALWRVARQFPGLRCLYVAFSKAIVEEFRDDIPASVTVKTLNSVGAGIVARNYGKVELNNDKLRDIFDELQPARQGDEEKARIALRSTVVQVAELCQGYLVNGSKEEIDSLADHHDIEDVGQAVYDLVPKILLFAQHRTKTISYNDQLWFPVVNNLNCPKFDLIFVDEAQDLNRCQHLLVSKLLADNGIVVAVGDDNQAIFGFRGSDVDSINNLAALLTANGRDLANLPLSVSRRCCKAVIARAQAIVPAIEALPDAPEGEIVNGTVEAADLLYQPGDLVICRTNAPLCSIAFGIIKRGLKAVIRGRDIGSQLASLINRLDADSVNSLLLKLDAWRTCELNKIVGTRREEQRAQNINDKADCIIALSEDCQTVDEVLRRIANVFADFDANGQPRGSIVLSSIHRAKGLEADRVFWACPEITIKVEKEWQQRQEANLDYVANTRAKRYLYLAKGAKKAAKKEAA